MTAGFAHRACPSTTTPIQQDAGLRIQGSNPTGQSSRSLSWLRSDSLKRPPNGEGPRLGATGAAVDRQHIARERAYHTDRDLCQRCAWDLEYYSILTIDASGHAAERAERRADIAGEPQRDVAPKAHA